MVLEPPLMVVSRIGSPLPRFRTSSMAVFALGSARNSRLVWACFEAPLSSAVPAFSIGINALQQENACSAVKVSPFWSSQGLNNAILYRGCGEAAYLVIL